MNWTKYKHYRYWTPLPLAWMFSIVSSVEADWRAHRPCSSVYYCRIRNRNCPFFRIRQIYFWTASSINIFSYTIAFCVVHASINSIYVMLARIQTKFWIRTRHCVRYLWKKFVLRCILISFGSRHQSGSEPIIPYWYLLKECVCERSGSDPDKNLDPNQLRIRHITGSALTPHTNVYSEWPGSNPD